jgi:hypothetical protein
MAERSKRKQRNALKHRAYSTIGQLPGSSIGLRVARINDLVQEHVEGQDNVDLVALAANIAESLVDLILLCAAET